MRFLLDVCAASQARRMSIGGPGQDFLSALARGPLGGAQRTKNSWLWRWKTRLPRHGGQGLWSRPLSARPCAPPPWTAPAQLAKPGSTRSRGSNGLAYRARKAGAELCEIELWLAWQRVAGRCLAGVRPCRPCRSQGEGRRRGLQAEVWASRYVAVSDTQEQRIKIIDQGAGQARHALQAG